MQSLGGVYQKQIFKINELVRDLMDQTKNKNLAEIRFKEKSEELKNLRENELCNNGREEKISSFNGIFENINERALILKCKCLIPLEDLSDSQILEKEKNLKESRF